jgi:hypothetical protein
MHQPKHAREFALLEEALTVLFCLVDDLYQNVNPNGRRYESLKKLTDYAPRMRSGFERYRLIRTLWYEPRPLALCPRCASARL